jgi:hypothetical protein
MELPEPSEYEVNIYTQDEFRLVAAIELVSPSNKDRPENRRTFVNKCETLLKKNVCVTIIDPVTNRTSNLFGELLDELDIPRATVSRRGIYSVSCRGQRNGPRWRLESWEHELAVGAALPTSPIWVSRDRPSFAKLGTHVCFPVRTHLKFVLKILFQSRPSRLKEVVNAIHCLLQNGNADIVGKPLVSVKLPVFVGSIAKDLTIGVGLM